MMKLRKLLLRGVSSLAIVAHSALPFGHARAAVDPEAGTQITQSDAVATFTLQPNSEDLTNEIDLLVDRLVRSDLEIQIAQAGEIDPALLQQMIELATQSGQNVNRMTAGQLAELALTVLANEGGSTEQVEDYVNALELLDGPY